MTLLLNFSGIVNLIWQSNCAYIYRDNLQKKTWVLFTSMFVKLMQPVNSLLEVIDFHAANFLERSSIWHW